MKRFVTIICIFTMHFGVNACKETNNKSKASLTTNATELEGTWETTGYQLKKSSLVTSTTTSTSIHTKTNTATSNLDGIWETDCFLNEEKSWETGTYTFSGSTVTITDSYFSNTSCQILEEQTAAILSYTLGSTASGVTEINFNVGTSLKKTLFSDDIAEAYSNESFCGFDYWQKNITVDIVGKTCGGEVITASPAIYSMIKIENNHLIVATSSGTNDGSTSGKRRKQLDGAPYKKK